METVHQTMKLLASVCVTAAVIAGTSATAEPLATGFEQTQVVPEKGGPQGTMRRMGWTFDEPLRLPADWKLNVSLTKDGEYRLITDPAKAHSGKHCIYLRGHLMTSRLARDVAAGDELDLRFYARDPAGKNVAAMLYTYRRREGGEHEFIATTSFFTAQTDADWVECSSKMTIPEAIGGKRVNEVIVVLVSATGTFLDDVKLVHTGTAEYRNFADALHAGCKHLEHNRYARARDDFSKALALAETPRQRIDGLSRTAESYRREKRYAETTATFREILAIDQLEDDTVREIRSELAAVHMAAGEYDKAREVLRTILETTPADDVAAAPLLLKIAECHEKRKEYAQAAKVLADVLTLPQADCLIKVATQFRIGAVWVSTRDYGKAREEYRKVLAMPGVGFLDQFEVWKRTGDTYRTQKEPEKAREAYRKALNVGDVNPYSGASLVVTLGDTFVEEKRYSEAREAYGELIGEGRTPWNHRVLAHRKTGETYGKEKMYVREREQYAAMLELVKSRELGSASDIARTEADVLRLTGDSYWTEGRKDEAEKCYVKWQEAGVISQGEAYKKHVASRIGENPAATCLRRAEELSLKEKYVEARAELGKALKVGNASPRQKALAHIRCGECYLAEKEAEKAEAELATALRVSGVGQEAKAAVQMRLADRMTVKGTYAEARSAYEKVLAMPGVPIDKRVEAGERIAALYRAEHEYKRARQVYETILEMEDIPPEQTARIAQRIRTIYW